MRWSSYCLIVLVALILSKVTAQENQPDKVLHEYSGTGATTTAFFKVQDHWEIRWNARQAVSVAVMSCDGTIVTGAAGVLRGSLYVPLGGQYYLKVKDSSDTASASAAPSTESDSKTAPADSTGNWHLQIVQIKETVNSDQALTVYAPYFIPPDSAITPVRLPPPPPVLSAEQAQTIVHIDGDEAQGTGFVIASPEGTYVATPLHLLAANPNPKISANGTPLTIVSVKAAVDCDIALISVKESLSPALPWIPGTKFETGDQIIIPDLGAKSQTLIGSPGRIIGINGKNIDFDNGLQPDGDGAPIIHVKTGHVLALVSPETNIDLSSLIAKNWAANPVPGFSNVQPYHGLLLDSAKDWQVIELDHFLAETLLLRQFHNNTRCLDSFLNGRRPRNFEDRDQTGLPDYQFYLKNDRLVAAMQNYKHLAVEADRDQRLEASRELLSDLESIVAADLKALQDNTHLYACNKIRAREEITYRLALKKELDDLASNLVRLDDIASAHLDL